MDHDLRALAVLWQSQSFPFLQTKIQSEFSCCISKTWFVRGHALGFSHVKFMSSFGGQTLGLHLQPSLFCEAHIPPILVFAHIDGNLITMWLCALRCPKVRPLLRGDRLKDETETNTPCLTSWPFASYFPPTYRPAWGSKVAFGSCPETVGNAIFFCCDRNNKTTVSHLLQAIIFAWELS